MSKKRLISFLALFVLCLLLFPLAISAYAAQMFQHDSARQHMAARTGQASRGTIVQKTGLRIRPDGPSAPASKKRKGGLENRDSWRRGNFVNSRMLVSPLFIWPHKDYWPMHRIGAG